MNFKLSPLGQNLVIKYAQIFRVLLIVLTIAVIHFVLPEGERFQYEYEKGKTWRHTTLVSPFDFALKKTKEQISEERNEITSTTLPIYKKESQNTFEEINRIKKEIKQNLEINADVESDEIDYDFISLEGSRLAKEILDRGYFKIDPIHEGKISVIEILEDKQTVRKNIASLITKDNLGQFLKSELSNEIKEIEKIPLISVISAKLRPNFHFDSTLTNLLIQQQLEALPETEGLIKQGETIISTGDRITSEKFRMLQNLEEEIAQTSGVSQKTIGVNAGRLIIVTLLITILGLFLYFIRQDLYNSTRSLFLILLIVTGMIVMVTWALKFDLPSVYLLPYCLVPIIIRVLFDSRIALFIHLIIILILGFSMPNGFEFIFYQFVAGVVSIFSMVNVSKRSQYFFSAGFIFAAYALCFTGLSLIKSGDLLTIPWRNVSWFLVSVILSLLAYPLIYLFERLFGITSDMTLLELTNANNPLLRELSYKAPGTFQHSLQVANLAEAAIYAIGGNPILVRAGALYHDIGKMAHPEYFIENQQKGRNPHDKLSFDKSAEIIIDHVYDGIEMAEEAGLPECIIDFIRTHHGNTRVEYFYQNYLKNFPEEFVDEKKFIYPGPIPFTKETAVLMLADSVEAASRSLKDPDADAINSTVDKIIESKMNQKQLVNANITLGDLTKVTKILKKMLFSIYHVRIEYPDQKK